MRAHLAESKEPLVAGQDQIALCGQTVSKAYFCFMFDTDSGRVEGLSTLLFCTKCVIAFAAPGRESNRYLYGCLDGEKAKHLESEP